MIATSSTLPPIRSRLELAVPAERAWTALTEGIGRWWPLADFSCAGAGGGVAFHGDRLVETAADGAEHVWGEVVDWLPPRFVRLTWHPGEPPSRKVTVLELTVVPLTDDSCRVELVHTGWERLPDPDKARAGYAEGWPTVLEPFERYAAAQA